MTCADLAPLMVGALILAAFVAITLLVAVVTQD